MGISNSRIITMGISRTKGNKAQLLSLPYRHRVATEEELNYRVAIY